MPDKHINLMSKVTPVRKQYLEVKIQFPHAIVFFRLGDFYETFDEDADTAARELDLTLTSRPVSKNQRVPMAGVPHHSVQGYSNPLKAHCAYCLRCLMENNHGLAWGYFDSYG